MNTTYFLCGDPASGCREVKSLQARARRHGYWLVHTPHAGWSVIDQVTGRFLEGLHDVSLAEAARAIVNLKAKAEKAPLAKVTKAVSDIPDRLHLFAEKIEQVVERAEQIGMLSDTAPAGTIIGDDPLLPKHTDDTRPSRRASRRSRPISPTQPRPTRTNMRA
jgi:hypothetical protein